MDKTRARAIAENELQFYREMTYEAISAKIGEQEGFERITEEGEAYQIEFDFFFDDNKSGNIRVAGIVGYSGWTNFFPVSSDFIIAPNGEFIGE